MEFTKFLRIYFSKEHLWVAASAAFILLLTVKTKNSISHISYYNRPRKLMTVIKKLKYSTEHAQSKY